MNNKKPKTQCYGDLLSKLDKLDLQVEGIKDQLRHLKQLLAHPRLSDDGKTPIETAEIVAAPSPTQGEICDE